MAKKLLLDFILLLLRLGEFSKTVVSYDIIVLFVRTKPDIVSTCMMKALWNRKVLPQRKLLPRLQNALMGNSLRFYSNEIVSQ